MDLPLIGGLFRTRRNNQIQRDLIILVTPNIVRSGL
jgi:type II secretory pathway component HofQ